MPRALLCRTAPALIIILDIDGTLVDTHKHLSTHVSNYLGECGVAFEPEDYFKELEYFSAKNGKAVKQSLFGGTWEDVYDFMLSKNPAIKDTLSEEAFVKQMRKRIAQNRELVTARHDVIKAVLQLKYWCEEQGIPVAIGAATNGTQEEAEANLALVSKEGLEMQAVVHADMVKNRKPAPDPFLYCREKLLVDLYSQGHQKEWGIFTSFYEDSPPGGDAAITSAKILSAQGMPAQCYYVALPADTRLLPETANDNAGKFFTDVQDIKRLFDTVKADYLQQFPNGAASTIKAPEFGM